MEENWRETKNYSLGIFEIVAYPDGHPYEKKRYSLVYPGRKYRFSTDDKDEIREKLELYFRRIDKARKKWEV